MPEITSHSEEQTQSIGEELANNLFEKKPAFVQLIGSLGAGKSAFARGFIRQWLKLSGEHIPDQIVSPTYNLVKVYGSKSPIAHFDLYRLHSLSELENLGYEHYFYEMGACLVEWLEQIPESLSLRPNHCVLVEISFGKLPEERIFKMKGL